MSNKKLALNFTVNVVSIVVTYCINFFLLPYIVETIGADAYGFVLLANSFVSYATIATIALNSVASRFVSVNYYQNDMESANKYFSSVVYANVFIVGILLVPISTFLIFIEKLINISVDLVLDVRLLFTFIFLNFLVGVISSIFSVSIFVKNKLYISSIRNIEANLIKALLLLIAFSMLPVKLFYIGVATLCTALYTFVYNVHYTKVLTPELTINRKNFSLNSIKELLSSGIWNIFNQLSFILNEGLDLLIANIFISSYAMGVLAISKTFPMLLSSLSNTLASLFVPDLTKAYAENNTAELKNTLDKSFKLMGLIISIAVGGIICCVDIFYSFWIPNQDIYQIQALTIITMIYLAVTGSTTCIHNLFTITNNLKVNSIVMMANGIINTLLVFILLKTTNLGVYAIAGVSTATTIIRNYIYTFPYAAKCIGFKWTSFYKQSIMTVISVIVIAGFGYCLRFIIHVDSWITFIIFAIIVGSFGFAFNIIFRFSKQDRTFVSRFIYSKIKTVIKK